MSDARIMTCFIRHEIAYDGNAIKSLWSFQNSDIRGDSIVSFIGPCDIPNENIVDSEDLKAGARIYSPRMLHFIVEHFDNELLQTIHRQRLLVMLAREWLEKNVEVPFNIDRIGDDLFIGQRKLSISIATATRVSTKIHMGVNIQTEGVPVPAAGLDELGIDPEKMAIALMQQYANELQGIALARSKVRGVD